MADFSTTWTARYRVRYRSVGRTHTITWRIESPVTGAVLNAAGLNAGAFFDALAPILPTDFSILSAQYAEQGNKFFLDTAEVPVVTETLGGGVIPAGLAATYVAFRYGTAFGNSGGVRVFGVNIALGTGIGSDYRISPGENAAVDDAINSLIGGFGWRAIDRSTPLWRLSATSGLDAGWQRRIRG